MEVIEMDEISELIKKVTASIDTGSGTEYRLDKPVEFDLSIVAESGDARGLDFRIVHAGGKASVQETHRVKFSLVKEDERSKMQFAADTQVAKKKIERNQTWDKPLPSIR